MNDTIAIVFFIALLLAGFWIVMFANMMTFRPELLPGKYDKFIWGAAFILVPPLAPFAFWAFKIAYKAALQTETGVNPGESEG